MRSPAAGGDNPTSRMPAVGLGTPALRDPPPRTDVSARLGTLMLATTPYPTRGLRQHNKEDPRAAAAVTLRLANPYRTETFHHPPKPFSRRERHAYRRDGSAPSSFLVDLRSAGPQISAPFNRRTAAWCPPQRPTHPKYVRAHLSL